MPATAADGRHIRFATDLCTFYNPASWGGKGRYGEMQPLFDAGRLTDLDFWERVFADVTAAGLDGIEVTFSPGDMDGATRAYGSASAFADRVAEAGLAICSGFLSTRSRKDGHRLDLATTDDRSELVESAEEYAEFLATCGATVMVTSPGPRVNPDGSWPRILDLPLAQAIATSLHEAGKATAKHGVRLALHPEAFSLFRDGRDTDLMMLLTDPAFVSLCPDTAQYTVAGSSPLEIASRHRDRLVLTHWKDAIGPAPKDVPIDDTIYARQIAFFAQVGQGVVDWPSWVRLLRDLNYTGWAVFELDGALDPVAELSGIRHFVETSLAHIYR